MRRFAHALGALVLVVLLVMNSVAVAKLGALLAYYIGKRTHPVVGNVFGGGLGALVGVGGAYLGAKAAVVLGVSAGIPVVGWAVAGAM